MKSELAITALGVLLFLTAAIGAPTAAAASQNTTAEEAVSLKKEAETLHEQLETFEKMSSVSVSESVLNSIEYNLERGGVAFENENYKAAARYYSTAIEQSKAELKTAYIEAAHVSLDTAEQRLSAVVARGYTSATTAELKTAIASERTHLQSASTFAEAKRTYEDAKQLEKKAKALPKPSFVRLAKFLDANGVFLLIGSVMLGIVFWKLRDRMFEKQDKGSISNY